MNDPALSATRKESKTNSMRRSEANFLRFLRTHERPQNYNTLKIIGKGAFGEVRLVQRKHDGKIYALKSLIKQEMVSCMPFFLVLFRSICHHGVTDVDVLAAQERPARSRTR